MDEDLSVGSAWAKEGAKKGTCGPSGENPGLKPIEVIAFTAGLKSRPFKAKTFRHPLKPYAPSEKEPPRLFQQPLKLIEIVVFTARSPKAKALGYQSRPFKTETFLNSYKCK